MSTINYSVIQYTDCLRERISYDIRVSLVDGRLPTKEQLAAVSKEILEWRGKRYKRIFVCFYLPGMELDAGAFATAHHNPDPEEVRIMMFHVPVSILSIIGLKGAKS